MSLIKAIQMMCVITITIKKLKVKRKFLPETVIPSKISISGPYYTGEAATDLTE